MILEEAFASEPRYQGAIDPAMSQSATLRRRQLVALCCPAVRVAPLLIAFLAFDVRAVNAGAPDAAAPARDRRAVAEQWQAQRVPAAGPALAIGTCSCGCLQGAAMLPAS